MIHYKIGKIVKKKGLSARQLAEAAKISPNTAALIIKAQTSKDYSIGADVMDKVCKVLKCQPGDLLEYKR